MNELLLSMLAMDKQERPADASEALARFRKARQSVGQESAASDTGTWVGEGEAGVRDELKPLRAKIAELVDQKGRVGDAERPGLAALASIADLDAADLDKLIVEIVESKKPLKAKQRLFRALEREVNVRGGALTAQQLASYDTAAEAVGWDRAKIKTLMDEAVAELKDQATSGASTGDTFTTLKRRLRLPLKPIAAALVSLLVLGGIGFAVHDWRQGQMAEAEAEQQRQLAEQQEDAAWEEARAADTLEAYQAFLTQWPDGLHRQAAGERIAQLEERGQNTIARVQDYLNRLGYRVPQDGQLETRTTESIRDFEQAQGLVVTGTPDEVVLDSLIEEYNQRDDAAWTEAGDDDSEASYQQYRENFPGGRYIDQVDDRIGAVQDREAWAVARGTDTETAYRQYAENFPQGAHIGEVEGEIARVQAETQRQREQAAAAERRRALITGIQTELQRLGRDVTIDGVAGQGTTDQIRAFERATDRTESGEPSESLLAALETTDNWPGLDPGETFRDCDACPEMVVIPAGSFRMGSPSGEADRQDDEGPQHNVSIRAFALASTEVTFAQWDACVSDGGCRHRPEDQGWGRGNRPVINVSWNDAQEYVRWLSRKTGEEYRLPSEAEWEYSARAGTTTRFSTGNCITTGQANFNGNYPANGCPKGQYRQRTVAVGSFSPNAFGLHDMHGNVWEWVQDCWNDSYRGAPSDGSAWMSGDCGRAVLRGGSWDGYGQVLRSAGRFRGGRDYRFDITGFRPARSVAL